MSTPVETMITRPQELPEVCAHLAAQPRFALDTEFVGEETYRPRLCLIQVATPERLILIDPFTVGPLDEFWQLVTDPNRLIIVHAGREEIRICQLWAGRPPGQLFDVQIAAGFIGLNYPLGHASLVSQVLGFTLSKSETLTEWRSRPLTDQQIKYAYDDVRHLLAVWEQLDARLTALDRHAWAREEFAALLKAATEEEPAQEKWRKLRGVGSLSARQLGVLREVFRWREETAAKVNRPARTVCRDDLLVEIARRSPTRDRDLQVIRGLPKRDTEAILAAVAVARALPPDQLPLVVGREQDPPQVPLLVSLLSAVLNQWAGAMELAPNLTCNPNDLRWLVRTALDGKPPKGGRSLLEHGWRKEVVRPVLEKVLTGDTVLRVADLRRPAPLELLPRPAP